MGLGWPNDTQGMHVFPALTRLKDRLEAEEVVSVARALE